MDDIIEFDTEFKSFDVDEDINLKYCIFYRDDNGDSDFEFVETTKSKSKKDLYRCIESIVKLKGVITLIRLEEE